MKAETSVMVKALTITLELAQKFQFHYVRLGHAACLAVRIATFLSTAESIASDFSLVIKIFLHYLYCYLTKMLHFGI